MTLFLGKSLLRAALALILIAPLGFGQEKETASQPPQKNQLACDQERGLALVEEQVDEAKTLEPPAQRIPIMIRAADLLWLYREEKARAIFTTAFDLAEKQFREKGDEMREEKGVRMQLPDQRFVVMNAIARRDAAWAKRLAERVADETNREAEKSAAAASTASTLGPANVSDKVIGLALSLLTIDQPTALNLVRGTFRSTASYTLPIFLFKLAETNQVAADQLFQEAVNANTRMPIDGLLYLSVYPFALKSAVGQPGSITTSYQPPPNFIPRPALQQLFLNAYLSRGEGMVDAPPPPAQGRGLSEPANTYYGLLGLEPLIAQTQPNAIDRALKLKAALGGLLTGETRSNLTSRSESRNRPAKGFDQLVDDAENEKDATRRDGALGMVILNAPDSESDERLLDLAKKISDLKFRGQLLDFLNFKFAQKATREGRLGEAAQFASKVEQLEERAYLSVQIAAEGLKRYKDRQRAAEILNEAAAAALKADNTNEKARALLGVTHVFASFDPPRAFEVLDDAIKTINHLTNPDFSSTNIPQRIQGPTFTRYAMLSVEGFSLENTFRELGPFDFDGAVILARKLEDKSQRATAIIALSAFCLEKPKAKQ